MGDYNNAIEGAFKKSLPLIVEVQKTIEAGLNNWDAAPIVTAITSPKVAPHNLNIPFMNMPLINHVVNFVDSHFSLILLFVLAFLTFSLVFRFVFVGAASFYKGFPIKNFLFELVMLPVYLVLAAPVTLFYGIKLSFKLCAFVIRSTIRGVYQLIQLPGLLVSFLVSAVYSLIKWSYASVKWLLHLVFVQSFVSVFLLFKGVGKFMADFLLITPPSPQPRKSNGSSQTSFKNNYTVDDDLRKSSVLIASKLTQSNFIEASNQLPIGNQVRWPLDIKEGVEPQFELASSKSFTGEEESTGVHSPKEIVEQMVIKIPAKITFITKPSSKNSVNDLEQFVNLAKQFKDKNKKRLVIANFKGASSRSFSRYVEGEIPFTELIYRGFIENADLITHAKECFDIESIQMRRFFAEAEALYDEIIIFTPVAERFSWDKFFQYPISEVEL